MPSSLYAAFTELKNAQKVKLYLLKHNLLHPDYLPTKELGTIYFPLTKKAKVPSAVVVKPKFLLQKKESALTIEDILKGKLTPSEMQIIPKSQEIIGKIMILEIPDQLQKKEKIIAQAYLNLNKNIETVVKKKSAHDGIFRTRKVTILAGKRTKETIHFENGIKLKLDLEKTYFSARSANERLRIAQLVKKDELILVMFSGAAPFPLVIAKNSPAKKIYGIEINPLAHHYALDNVLLNKLEDKIIIYEGDVNNIIPEIKKKFDRIVMPLPRTGELFLGLALTRAKPGTIIHLYSFLDEHEITQYSKKIRDICKGYHHTVRILRKVKCGQFSPGTFRVCFDLLVLK